MGIDRVLGAAPGSLAQAEAPSLRRVATMGDALAEVRRAAKVTT